MSGDRFQSIVFSMRARDASGALMPIGASPVQGGTGVQLMASQRTISMSVARAIGAKEAELGGMLFHNAELEALLVRQQFTPRSIFSTHLGESVDYRSRVFPVR